MAVLEESVGLDPQLWARIEAVVVEHQILQDVVRWVASTGREIGAVITQDEYTHDVVIRWDDDVWLVYDCT